MSSVAQSSQQLHRPTTRLAGSQCTNALVLSGGGARAAYQAGVLRYVGEQFPEAAFPVLTGVSAGSINVAHLANHPGTFRDSTDELVECWAALCANDLFRPKSTLRVLREILGFSATAEDYALVDPSPLRAYLCEHLDAPGGRLLGIQKNVQANRLQAVAITTSNYTTRQTVTWVQGEQMQHWARPNRVGRSALLTLDHVMASAALPFLFPAVQLGAHWYGDGGIRLLDPLAPAIHLGADRLFVISTRYRRSRSEAQEPSCTGYPPLAQIAGMLTSVLFLDVLEHDAAVLQRVNTLVRKLPEEEPTSLRPLDVLVIRPSEDLGKMAHAYEVPFGGAAGRLAQLMGARQTRSADWMSMMLFTPAYAQRLMDLGYDDARQQHQRIAAFLQMEPAVPK